ncbi:beta-glucanosyltransferase gel2 [Grosmannia clavigera kw1407]|uniref:1,3-beta-glucanosyltransferase n=1 Tax=Grosmannia clavigera (strain kw1407 / UAMH 11150) TaxID=655863 RepID=F0XRT5_GROCL|nr:beta-glucanosyltransferase gel2 [Grosmannia clavigera kw1407]EFW99571.1 beta-glucanosyltransferase gel2 [Grosmannia clavigera kw1407]
MFVATTLLALGATLVSAVPSLVVKGSQFVNPSTGDRFQVVGVAYQPGGSSGYNPSLGFDPLSDGSKCLRDAALMQILGINAIRVYNLDPDLNHDECASIFNDAGMYLMIDVNSPLVGESLNSDEPWTSYYAAYLNRTFAVVEAFRHYPNTLLFFSGNEVISDLDSAKAAPPYIRAVTRDIKTYIAKHSDRSIPVGYSAADVRSVLFDSWNYFQCAESGVANDTSRADVFALNSYSWCGDSSFTTSGYDTLVEGFSGTSIPVFYSEFGCNVPAPRIFTEVSTIYSDKMMPVFSGGVVYEYANEVSNFGLVNISTDGSVDILQDFYTLRDRYSKIDFKSIQTTVANTSTTKPPVCSSKLISSDGFDSNFTLPVLPPGAQQIIDNGVSPKPSGKIIAISNWNVKFTVRNPDGTVLSNLSVKPISGGKANTPGSNTASSTSIPTSSKTPTASMSSGASASATANGSIEENSGTDRSVPMPVTVIAFTVFLPSIWAWFT